MELNKQISNVLKTLVGTAGIFILGMVFSFIFNWAITKYLPQKEVGVFQYYISMITFAMVIVPLGYQSLAQREAINLNKNSLKRLSSQAILAILFGSTVFSSIWFFGVTKYKWVKDLEEYHSLMIGIIIIPIYALNVFFRAVLQGQNKIYSSVVPDVLIRPILLLLSLILLPFLGLEITATSLLNTLFIILFGALIFSILKTQKNITEEGKSAKSNWLKQALILLPIGLISTVNERIDVIMITKTLGPEANAIYSVAFKFALFSGFGLVILNQVMVPQYALYFKKNTTINLLQDKIKVNVRLSFVLSLAVVLFLLLLGKDLLNWFGKPTENYALGYTTILILAFGQLFNVAVGSTGYILTMAKKESLVMLSIVTGIIVNVLLNYFLVPIMHIEGAAIATSASIIVWNIMMLIFVKTKTKINPTII